MIPNAVEIRKFSVLSLSWLTVVFVAVWAVCWTVGIFIPALLANSSFDFARTIIEICRAITPLIAVMVFIPINAMFMVLLERRALALFTRRNGPNRVGPDGALQTAADAIKLLLKEDITPTGADAFMFTLAPIVFFAPSIFGAIPLLAAVTNNHILFQITDLPTGIFFVLAASSIPVVGIVMGGWASNNKYSLMGGLRSAAQAISYEIPLVLSLITICLLAGSLDVVTIAKQQAGGLLNWNILGGGALTGVNKAIAALLSANGTPAAEIMQTYYPMGWWSLLGVILLCISTVILFGIYLTAACAEINRIPFDLPEAESELVSGYNTEYSGIKFAIFFLAEFTNLFIVSTIAVVMFLGGGDCPLPSWLNPLAYPVVYEPLTKILSPVLYILIDKLHLINPDTFWAVLWAITKTYTLVVFAILVRGTLPRFRIDQLMDFGWKRLVPITLVLFVLVAFARGVINFHV
jgi:NADH-quinone oxidoreductase subunit H